MECGRIDGQRGFSLVALLVSLSVMSVMAMALMTMQKNHFQANAAVQWDLDVYTFRRNIVSQTDCNETWKRLRVNPVRGQSIPVDLYAAPSSRPGSGVRKILEGRPEGTPFGSKVVFRFRADLTEQGIVLLARADGGSGAVPGTTRAVARHPVLGENHKWRDWNDASPGNMPLCTPEQGVADSGDTNREFAAELVLTRQSTLVAKDGDMNVTVLHAVDGGGDCHNILVLNCNLASGRRTFRLGQEDARERFVLPEGRSCDVSVESRLRSGGGSCKAGYVTGIRKSNDKGAGSMVSDNALTMQQGWSSYRIQWEDRLAYADDGRRCDGGKGDPGACQRLRAMDWNDGVWMIEGSPASSRPASSASQSPAQSSGRFGALSSQR